MYIQATSPSQLLMFLGEILRFTQRFALMFLQTSLPEICSDSTGFGHQVEGELLRGFSGKACKGASLDNSETGSRPEACYFFCWLKEMFMDQRWSLGGAELVVKHMSINS